MEGVPREEACMGYVVMGAWLGETIWWRYIIEPRGCKYVTSTIYYILYIDHLEIYGKSHME